MTGHGIKEFFDAVDASRDEYEKCVRASVYYHHCDLMMVPREYLPELERARAHRDQSLKAVKEESMNRMMKDLSVDRAKNPSAFANDTWDPEEIEGEDDDNDSEVNIIDRSTFPLPPTFYGVPDFIPGEERWPGQYIDVTRARRHPDENINWPRPG